ncbi:MAG: EamA family transporter [Parvibaculales bacterium]
MHSLALLFEPHIWVFAALGAGLGQALRSVIQKHQREGLGLYGSAYVRFVFGIPVAWLLLFLVVDPVPDLTGFSIKFYGLLLAASLIQILFTILLGHAFEQRNFATSITLSKTDAIQAGIFELIFLAVLPGLNVVAAILLGLFAVALLTLSKNAGRLPWRDRFEINSVMLGLAAGFCLGFCSVLFRLAMDTLPELAFLDRAILASTLAISLQTIIMGVGLRIYAPDELRACLRSGWKSLPAGSIAAVTTFLWFLAFNEKGVAPVRMLGHVEILFSLLFGSLFFKEKVSRPEMVGIVLIIISVVILLS